MSVPRRKEPALLALYFNTRGFGYVLLEGPMDPVDWGMKTPRRTTEAATMRQVRQLLDMVAPSILVLQRCRGPFMRCSARVKGQVAKTAALARRRRITVARYSRSDVRACFAPHGAQNKVEIAQAIAARFPEFQSRVPPPRKPWVKEHHQMGFFDATALAFTHYWKESPARD